MATGGRAAAEEVFSKAVRAEDFAAAGLSGYWMTIEGVATRVKVLLLGGK